MCVCVCVCVCGCMPPPSAVVGDKLNKGSYNSLFGSNMTVDNPPEPLYALVYCDVVVLVCVPVSARFVGSMLWCSLTLPMCLLS
jgi:hypothetical protein